jgi:hypothetical protein
VGHGRLEGTLSVASISANEGGRLSTVLILVLHLQGKVALVTGATSGIGLETAAALAGVMAMEYANGNRVDLAECSNIA